MEVAEEIAGVTAQIITEMVLPIFPNRQVVSVAKNDLTFEMFLIMSQLFLYRRELGVKLNRLFSFGHIGLLLPAIATLSHVENDRIIIPYLVPENNEAF